MTLKFWRDRDPGIRKTGRRSAKLYIIATEGAQAEPQYFDMFQNPAERPDARGVKCTVVIIPTEAGQSSPEHVIARLDECKEAYSLRFDDPDDDYNDELWLVTDTDRWPVKNLVKVARKARIKGYKLAVSNPCFDLWLYLHFNDIESEYAEHGCKQCKDYKQWLRENGIIRDKHGKKYNLRTEKLKGREQTAINNAKKIDKNPNARWPAKTGTHVYKIIELLLSITPQ